MWYPSNDFLQPLLELDPWQDLVALPDGWQACDGKSIRTGRWKGFRTPDLNTARRFLRGGPDRDMLALEEDQLEDHTHKFHDPGHTHGYDDKG